MGPPTSDSSIPQGAARHSTDLRWWWDGWRWFPAVSPAAVGVRLAVRQELHLFLRVWGLATGASLVGYVLAMNVASQEPGQDDAAALGVMVLAVPTAGVMAGLIGLGIAAGRIANRTRQRAT